MTTIVYNSLFSPNPISLPSIKPNGKTLLFLNPNNLPSIPISHNTQRRNLPLPAVASIPYPPINVDYLESEFNGHGVSFKGIGERCVVKMGLENGSVATLMLPSGMITSYKARMWHGGLLEVLHTLVTEGEDGAVIQGGVTLAFKFQSDEGESWSPSKWALLDVKGNPQESIQVELISTNSEDVVEVKHIVTLKEDEISSEVVIKNSKDSSLCFMGSVMSHLAVSTPEATYAVGLENSNFFNKPPVLSKFTIMPPNFSLRDDLGSNKNFWGGFGFKEFFEGWGAKTENSVDGEESEDGEEGEECEELEGEEDDDYKHLTEKISRIYTSAPRSFTVMDRGKRNSVVIGRDGFKEMYMFSPGSTYEWYSKYAYICIGQSALLEPVILAPKGEWRGAQHLHNPNM